MPPQREVSMETRVLIIAHHKGGITNRQIAITMKIYHATVDYNVKEISGKWSHLKA